MYELIVSLIGPLPIEFEFIYGLGTLVACLFGILLIFAPLMIAFKIMD